MKKRFSIIGSVLMFCLLLNPTFVQANEYQGKAEEFEQTGEKYQSASEVFRKEEVDSNAADWCYKQISKPYNLNYNNISTRKKFYCSQLVWAAFLDNYNINLNTPAFANFDMMVNPIHPLELVWTDETNLIYEK